MSSANYLSLSMANKFSFRCPIFDADVQMRSCVLLREKVYSGHRLETRRGCQACISSSKCPAAELVRRIAFGTSDATDHCSSEEEKIGKLPADVLEKIRPVLITDQTIQMYHPSAQEIDLISTSTARIDAQIPSAPRGATAARAPKVVQSVPNSGHLRDKPKSRAEVIVPQKTMQNAAVSGDMAAAINAGDK